MSARTIQDEQRITASQGWLIESSSFSEQIRNPSPAVKRKCSKNEAITMSLDFVAGAGSGSAVYRRQARKKDGKWTRDFRPWEHLVNASVNVNRVDSPEIVTRYAFGMVGATWPDWSTFTLEHTIMEAGPVQGGPRRKVVKPDTTFFNEGYYSDDFDYREQILIVPISQTRATAEGENQIDVTPHVDDTLK
jgi:hypothetical protein